MKYKLELFLEQNLGNDFKKIVEIQYCDVVDTFGLNNNCPRFAEIYGNLAFRMWIKFNYQIADGVFYVTYLDLDYTGTIISSLFFPNIAKDPSKAHIFGLNEVLHICSKFDCKREITHLHRCKFLYDCSRNSLVWKIVYKQPCNRFFKSWDNWKIVAIDAHSGEIITSPLSTSPGF